METGVLVPLIFFGFLAAVILVPILAKEQTKRSAHHLISQAMERGQTLNPALVNQISQNMLHEGNQARRSLGKGVILLALAGGFVGAAYVGDGFDSDAHGMFIPAVIFGAVGVAFVLLALVDYATKSRAA